MANLLPDGKQSYFTSAGAPLVGGKLYTYAAGTTTLKPTYADAAGTAPNTNPVILDARGEAVVFFSGNYKVQLQDSTGAVIWTVDNVSTAADLAGLAASNGAALVGFTANATGSTTRTVSAALTDYLSVLDFTGVDPTGTADSTVGFQAALAAAANGKLFVPPGTYRITNTLNVFGGTVVEFAGFGAVINFTGSGTCFQVTSAKHISFIKPQINMANAASTAIGIGITGGWFIRLDHPIFGSITGQTAINIVTSAVGNLGFGSYMIEVFNPFFNSGTYGIKTSQQTGDTVQNTHITVYDGWGNNTTYPLWFRNVATFNVLGFTPEGCVDGVNIASCAAGYIHLGEPDCSGFSINFPDATSSGMTVVATSSAGNNVNINTAFYTPTIFSQGLIRLNASPSPASNNYYYSINSQLNYGQSLLESVNGGGTARTLRTYDDVNWQRLYNVKSLSGTGVVGANLRGVLTFAASTTVAAVFPVPEPDAAYFVTLSGNAAGFCWVTNKTATGFTINCSASNSNSVDFILVR